MNTPAFAFIPAKAGLWDAAALHIKDTTWAINFNESKLGNDHFDMYQDGNFTKRKPYKDVFDGMIYYKHPKDFRIVEGYEYMIDGYNKDTLLKRQLLSGRDSISAKNGIKFYEKNKIEDKEAFGVMITNLLYACFHFIILFFLLINLVVQYFKKQII